MKSSWKQCFFVLSYFKKRKVIFLLVLIFVSSVLSLCPPQIISYILDNGVVKASPRTIICCGLLLICVYSGSFFINYLISQTLTKLKSYFIADIKQDLFEQILKLPMEFFDKQPTGYVLERIKETDNLNVFFSPVFVKFVAGVLSFIGALALVLAIRWEMAIVIALFLPVIYCFTNYSNIQIKKASKILLEATAETSGQVQENIGGISAIKELKLEKQRSEEISKQLKSAADKSVRSGKVMNLASEGIIGISNIAAAVLVVCSGLFIVNEKMSLGDYWAVSQYTALVFAPVQLLSSISVMVQPGIVALARIGELLKIKTEDEISGNQKIGKIETVVFSDVSFGYDEKPVIQHFSMEAHKSTKVVLLGKNGSGKTTIAKLLLGFYKNYFGSIRINDIELRDISLSDLRSRIGSVAQNIFLFSGTLLDNIRYIAPELKEQEVISVLNRAGLDISEFEYGLNSPISENGKNLSGGQRQKIALARMIVKNPDVMIFDEATANLDIASSALLKESIKTYFNEKICLIITHDTDMTSIADTVINLSD